MKNLKLRMNVLAAIARAYKVALKVRCNHIAGIYLDNRLIAYGRNQKKSHPLQAKFSDREHRIYLHAEIDAIVKFLHVYPIQNLERAEMLVIRITADGELAPSRPCAGCQKAILTFNFKDVAWS